MDILDWELYSDRLRREQGQMPDVYIYDDLPKKLRVQITHIIRDSFGRHASSIYDEVLRLLLHHFGELRLNNYRTAEDQIAVFILEEQDPIRVLDAIEACFKYLVSVIANDSTYSWAHGPALYSWEAVRLLNKRLEQNGVGYRFERDKVIRVDSQLVHQETVRPALVLLSQPGFEGANEEFLKAHEHYRHGRYKETLLEAAKSFESTLKIICDLRGWSYGSGDTARHLIKICLDNGLLPPYLETQLNTIRSLLESGLPTMRNKTSAHGQGPSPVEAPRHLAAYGLHLAAANILFVVNAHMATAQNG